MTTLVCVLFALLVASDSVISALIRCRKCDYDLEAAQEVCDADCSGSLCFYSEYYFTKPEKVFTKKGCMSGAAPAVGCRTNQDGEILCICNTDYCNRDELLLKAEPITLLPWQVCKQNASDGLAPTKRWTPPCAANYCLYKKSKFSLEDGSKGYSYSIGCSSANDFDVFYTRIPFMFYPESCAKMEYGGQPEETICYGSMADDSASEYPAEGLVECHADFLSRTLPYIPVRKLCRGQYCVIAASPLGDVYRGCITLDQSKTERQITPGYYQSYTGMEQWVCATSSCNYDLQKMEESWPEEMAEFKNISRLRISGLFEELNSASTTINSLLFVVILILIEVVM